MNCTVCHKPVVLSPSAAERAKRFGGKASDYTAIFPTHADCALAQREAAIKAFLAQQRAQEDK